MSELKPCPFCGNSPIKYNQTGLIVCAYAMCGANPESKSKEDWNARHNEDEAMRDPKCELEAAKAEIEKLSPLVEIVPNQKQRIQQLEEALHNCNFELAEFKMRLTIELDSSLFLINDIDGVMKVEEGLLKRIKIERLASWELLHKDAE